MLFTSDGTLNEFDQTGTKLDDITKKIDDAIEKLGSPNYLQESITSMEDSARSLSRTMNSGMVLESNKFREQLFESYEGVVKLGGTFKDITEAVAGFAEGMNKVVFMSNQATSSGEKFGEALFAMERSTGIQSKELGKMTAEYMRFEGSQIKSIESMQKISKIARVSGADSKSVLNEVQGYISKLDAYGFKNGIEGLAKMSTQAKILRTDIDKIGAMKLADDLLNPEKAIEVASNLQMLGGAIGDLGSPFKLMNMGMNDVEELQNQLIDLSANAYNVNKETGKIEIDPLSRQRLREQATALGVTYEEYVKMGKEAKKAKEVMDALSDTSFGDGMPQEQKDLLASLTEFKGGKMTLDIPGLSAPIDDLEAAMKDSPNEIQAALEKYQKTAELSEKDIASKGLGLQESLNADARAIRDILLRNLTEDQRNTIANNLEKGIDIIGKSNDKAQQRISNQEKKADNDRKDLKNQIDKKKEEVGRGKGGETYTDEDMTNGTTSGDEMNEEEDATFSTGKKVLSMGKGQMFNFIKDDEAMFAPDLLKNMDILKNSYNSNFKIKEMMSSEPSNETGIESNAIKMMAESIPNQKPQSSEVVQKVVASGDINININVNSNGTLSDALMKDRSFTEELKSRVINIIQNKSNISVEKGQMM
jgi:hypothetical protein